RPFRSALIVVPPIGPALGLPGSADSVVGSLAGQIVAPNSGSFDLSLLSLSSYVTSKVSPPQWRPWRVGFEFSMLRWVLVEGAKGRQLKYA
ncbi:hypothetical protein U1Q18_017720, partial [Sarracenia purpurea var. burkii]